MSITVVITLNGVPVPIVLDDVVLSAISGAVSANMKGPEAWPEWMSVETVARYLDCSPQRVRKLVARREIPFVQEATGCRLSFSRLAIDEWMESLETRERPLPRALANASAAPPRLDGGDA